MSTEAPTRGFVAPYIPFARITNLVEKMKREGIPARIDRSYLSFLSGTDQTYLISALKTFGLIGPNGEVEPGLRDWADGTENPKVLVRDILHDNYPEAVALGTDATHAQLEEVFRKHYGVGGETARKAVTFYLHAAAFAEIPLSPHFKMPRQAGARTPSGTPRKARAKSKPKPKPPSGAAAGSGGNGEGISLPPVHPALAGVLSELPPRGSGWTQERHDEFMTTFEAVVGFTIPIVDDDEEEDEDEQLEVEDADDALDDE